MSLQYNRLCEVEIITGDYDSKGVFTVTDTKTIKDLRVSFQVTHSIIGYPNLADIRIFNPLTDRDVEIESANGPVNIKSTMGMLQRPGTKIKLSVGYEATGVETIFYGDVKNVYLRREDVDTFALIYANAYRNDWERSELDVSFETITLEDLINTLVSALPNTSHTPDVTLIREKLDAANKAPFSRVISGKVKDELDALGKEFDFGWMIKHDGQVVFVDLVESVELADSDQAVVITNSTGMLGIPTLTFTGVEVENLLNTRLNVGELFKIEHNSTVSVNYSSQYFTPISGSEWKTRATGQYRLMQIVHTGDTHDNTWESKITGYR